MTLGGPPNHTEEERRGRIVMVIVVGKKDTTLIKNEDKIKQNKMEETSIEELLNKPVIRQCQRGGQPNRPP